MSLKRTRVAQSTLLERSNRYAPERLLHSGNGDLFCCSQRETITDKSWSCFSSIICFKEKWWLAMSFLKPIYTFIGTILEIVYLPNRVNTTGYKNKRFYLDIYLLFGVVFVGFLSVSIFQIFISLKNNVLMKCQLTGT